MSNKDSLQPGFKEFFSGLKERAEKTDSEKVKEAFHLLSLQFPPKSPKQ